MYIYIHNIYTYIHTCMLHACMHAYIHIYIHAHTHTHTHTHTPDTYTYTHTHTHIHTHTHVFMVRFRGVCTSLQTGHRDAIYIPAPSLPPPHMDTPSASPSLARSLACVHSLPHSLFLSSPSPPLFSLSLSLSYSFSLSFSLSSSSSSLLWIKVYKESDLFHMFTSRASRFKQQTHSGSCRRSLWISHLS